MDDGDIKKEKKTLGVQCLQAAAQQSGPCA